ncbi:hypothetical protein R3W88_024271 [Solanum pinnatisectum]|uniref:Retrotransposon Copia-like N-terminal domain-containing protein n=1 Tax=Solanum pinnatisectum TaxID=50273 RepID=A0AAV9M0R9_9SOLN|nr:hypothetical protein R3W88_024271 [Solanum pinnatisectum]
MGSGNYGLWRRSMTIVLQAKRKLGFVKGNCKKHQFSEELHEDWDTYYVIVLSWIMNTISACFPSGIVYSSNAHLVWEDLKERFDKVNKVRIFQLLKEIATLSQGTNYIVVYFTKLRVLWAEYDALVPAPSCDCAKSKEYIKHLQGQRLLQFISGLNESYDQVRRQLLLKTVEPSLNQGYAMLSEDESQRSCPFPVLTSCPGHPDHSNRLPNNEFKKKQYPPNAQKKPYHQQFDKKPSNSRFERKQNFAAHNVMNGNERPESDESSGSGQPIFTDEQYRQLQQLYGRNGPRFSNEQYRQMHELLNEERDLLIIKST